MSEGIQETKEVLQALNMLSIDLIKLFKKHAGVAEFGAALLGDAELKDALMKAYDNVAKVPAELGDIQFAELIELGLEEAKAVPALLAALKA